MKSSAKVQASAILATYNSQKTIGDCIASLKNQSVPIEIIVIDDGSTDSTLTTLKEFNNITILKQNHAGPALARNFGVRHAKSDIILFVDADMTFDPDYVQQLIKPIINNGVIGTYTTQERVSNWENIWARCTNFQEGWEDKKRFPKNPPTYGTDYRAIRKSEFDRVGGFDNIGYTDTWSLFNKLGIRPLATQAICYHKNPDTLQAVFRQARWSGKRPYKFGLLGLIYALFRTSLPFSIIIGLIKSFSLSEYRFFVYKIVYDLGRFVGILELIIIGKLSK